MLLREKENDMLRLVIDARRANRRFDDAPGVDLATPEALARLEVADGVTPYMAEVMSTTVSIGCASTMTSGASSAYRLFVPRKLGYIWCAEKALIDLI